MRTTLTIKDTLADELKQRALETGKPFKDVINETLLQGLQVCTNPKSKPYRLKSAELGQPLSGIDLTKALRLSDELEEEALRAKLEHSLEPSSSAYPLYRSWLFCGYAPAPEFLHSP
jgi:hypothetical protein